MPYRLSQQAFYDPLNATYNHISKCKVRKAKESSTISMKGYPTIISLYGCNTPTSRRILCAHELGHALLHTDTTINRFNGTIQGIQNRCEYEANLFAVALIFDEDEFNISFSQMDNWTLKMILDYNLE